MLTNKSKPSFSSPTVGFGLLLAGLLFFINPLVGIHDILPDALGFAFVYLSLSRVSDMDAYFADARKNAGFLTLLCTVKHLAALSLLRASDSSLSLPFTFIASVLELIFVLPFIKKLFHGFEYTAMRLDAGEIVKKTADTRRFCVLYVILQSVLAFVPQLITFVKQQEEVYFKANSTYALPTSVVYNYVLAFTLVAELILGIVYAAKLIGYFAAVHREKDYRAALYARSAEARRTDETKYASRTLGVSAILAALSSVCITDVTVDGTDYVPALLAALFGLAAVFVFAARGKNYAAPPLYLFALVPAGLETAYQLFTGKTADALLHGEADRLPDIKAADFVCGGSAVMLTCVMYLLGGAAMFVLIRAYLARFQSLGRDTLLGNHDRALLRSALLFGAAYVFKCASGVLRLVEARLASDAGVAKYIGMRSRMTALAMEQAKASDPLLSRFEALETAAFYCGIVCIVLVVFTVFSLLALRGEVIREEQ